MPECGCLLCFLTDKTGNILNPYKQGSIKFIQKSGKGKCRSKCNLPGTENSQFLRKVKILIQGYVVLYNERDVVSEPVMFSAEEQLILNMPPETNLIFSVRDFECCAFPDSNDKGIAIYKIFIKIKTIVRVVRQIELTVPTAALFASSAEKELILPSNPVSIITDQVFDRKCFKTIAIVDYERFPLKAEVYQYNALSDGVRKIYTNGDELIEYGDQGILAPDSVSFYAVFINGVLQPPVCYKVQAGLLTLETDTAPLRDAPIIITFVTFKDKAGHLIKSENYQYNTVSDGVKSVYTNADELLMYGNKGLLNPNAVSYYNVFINGELQPETNYILTEGQLMLTMSEVPMPGVPIIVEFIILRDDDGNILKGGTYEYNALGADKKIYTNSDELVMYGSRGILNPDSSSYQNLYINGVLQPKINYTVRTGLLTLNTEDTPIIDAPISLQFVFLFDQ